MRQPWKPDNEIWRSNDPMLRRNALFLRNFPTSCNVQSLVCRTCTYVLLSSRISNHDGVGQCALLGEAFHTSQRILRPTAMHYSSLRIFLHLPFPCHLGRLPSAGLRTADCVPFLHGARDVKSWACLETRRPHFPAWHMILLNLRGRALKWIAPSILLVLIPLVFLP